MNAYRLGVVAFAVVGLLFLVEAARAAGTVVAIFGLEAGGRATLAQFVASLAIPLLVGAALFAGRGPIARRLFLRGEDAQPGEGMLPLEDMQAAAIAAVAVWVLLDNAWRALRIALPMLGYGPEEAAPLTDLVPDVLTLGLGALLFLRARRVARWWCRREEVTRDRVA